MPMCAQECDIVIMPSTSTRLIQCGFMWFHVTCSFPSSVANVPLWCTSSLELYPAQNLKQLRIAIDAMSHGYICIMQAKAASRIASSSGIRGIQAVCLRVNRRAS